MELKIENFREIKIEGIDPGNFVGKDRWQLTLRKLNELKIFIDEMMRIVNSQKYIPVILVSNATGYAKNLIVFLEQFQTQDKGQPAEIAHNYSHNISR